MSGFVAVLDPAGAASVTVETMVAAIAHRGPDRVATWEDGPVALGHCLFATTPEAERERQAAPDPEDGFVIVADARIDNRDELLETLGLPVDPTSPPLTDDYLIIEAYRRWSDRCVDHLIGDFAFMIWDPAVERLFGARDHFGVRPFFYSLANGVVVAASEIKALLAHPQVDRTISDARIAEQLAMMSSAPELTTYEAIRRLPPAHTFIATSAGVTVSRYWSLRDSARVESAPSKVQVALFRAAFREAVRCRLRSNGRIASHLSGGLDSSSVTCVAAQLCADAGDPPPVTISNVFDTVTACDEQEHMGTVLDALGGLRQIRVPADRWGPLSNIDSLTGFLDEPYIGANHQLVFGLNQASHDHGFRVCLDGFDGDLVVSHGLERLHELAHQQEWSEFARQLRGVQATYGGKLLDGVRQYALPHVDGWIRRIQLGRVTRAIGGLHRHLAVSRLWLVKRSLLVAGSAITRRLWRRPLTARSDRELSQLPTEELISRFGLQERLEARHPADPAPTSARETHIRSLESPALASAFESIDLYAAMFSIEARHPFFDKRVVELSVSLPADSKLDEGWGRKILRDAMEGTLPEQNRWRLDKTSMHPNFVHGLLVVDRDALDDIIQLGLEPLAPLADLDFIRRLHRQVLAKPVDQVTTPEITTLWAAVVIARLLAGRSTSRDSSGEEPSSQPGSGR